MKISPTSTHNKSPEKVDTSDGSSLSVQSYLDDSGLDIFDDQRKQFFKAVKDENINAETQIKRFVRRKS